MCVECMTDSKFWNWVDSAEALPKFRQGIINTSTEEKKTSGLCRDWQQIGDWIKHEGWANSLEREHRLSQWKKGIMSRWALEWPSYYSTQDWWKLMLIWKYEDFTAMLISSHCKSTPSSTAEGRLKRLAYVRWYSIMK